MLATNPRASRPDSQVPPGRQPSWARWTVHMQRTRRRSPGRQAALVSLSTETATVAWNGHDRDCLAISLPRLYAVVKEGTSLL